MPSQYDYLDRDALIRLLQRRDAERQLGLVWERDEIEADAAVNDDYVALSLDTELSHGAAPWPNLIIEGDNFDALRALRMTHRGAIRCIYIDPPYNTGNRDFVYNDCFIDKTHRYRHSLWLEFMYRRLQLAKELLADDGVIFVSIDDNELFRLGMLMDRVFGEQNFVANFIWNHRKSSQNDTDVSLAHNYTLCYARTRDRFSLNPLPVDADKFNNTDGDQRGPWVADPFDAPNIRKNLTYPIKNPKTGKEFLPPQGRHWRFTEDRYLEALKEGRIVFGKHGTGKPQYKRFLFEAAGKGKNIFTIWNDVGTATEATKELMAIFDGEKMFNTPKPVSLIERILSVATDKEAWVLDFFAGSGTTAHAVAKLNAEDGGHRRFILISNTEATQAQPDKNLCRDVCAERLRRVLGGYTNTKGQAVAGLGGGFAYLRAHRIPRHRLTMKLDHAEVWHALQLLHGKPLTPWPACGFTVDGESGDVLAYLADFRVSSITRLDAWLAGATVGAMLYSWAPERLTERIGGLSCLPIPQYLRARFGR
ncbi:methyltransferase [Xylella fastidiosa]|uniref:site-specific DNA-methyltransferase (adenine-specific) n=1 Tax=Xylella fastidiosa (strain 9a5c) TaxID=160492 RepID=Q9PC17_XYLFA|nr:site-specific DNA-methyltransferase [Xylella fastidiosa]AAF84770.1 methyltransferase [Xylella fastidiosa 9a5c]ALQ95184.1 methyltransferase [Xylella fastidiosa]